MINLLINSGYSFSPLRKSLTEYLLNKNCELKIITPNNSFNIRKKIIKFSNKIINKKYYDTIT